MGKLVRVSVQKAMKLKYYLAKIFRRVVIISIGLGGKNAMESTMASFICKYRNNLLATFLLALFYSCSNDNQLGVKNRTRSVQCGDDCPDTSESVNCTLPQCRKYTYLLNISVKFFEASWSEWAKWSTCSTNEQSKNGTRARTRLCSGAEIGSQWCPIDQSPLGHRSQLLGYLQIDRCLGRGKNVLGLVFLLKNTKLFVVFNSF